MARRFAARTRTPGKPINFAVSVRTISACGGGLRRVLPYNRLYAGIRSAENCASPVTFTRASVRVTDCPTTWRGERKLVTDLAMAEPNVRLPALDSKELS